MSRAWLLHKWTDRVLLTNSLWVPASPPVGQPSGEKSQTCALVQESRGICQSTEQTYVTLGD